MLLGKHWFRHPGCVIVLQISITHLGFQLPVALVEQLLQLGCFNSSDLVTTILLVPIPFAVVVPTVGLQFGTTVATEPSEFD